MVKSKPVRILCTYRPKKGKEQALLALVKRHWPALNRRPGDRRAGDRAIARPTSGRVAFISWRSSRGGMPERPMPRIGRLKSGLSGIPWRTCSKAWSVRGDRADPIIEAALASRPIVRPASGASLPRNRSTSAISSARPVATLSCMKARTESDIYGIQYTVVGSRTRPRCPIWRARQPGGTRRPAVRARPLRRRTSMQQLRPRTGQMLLGRFSRDALCLALAMALLAGCVHFQPKPISPTEALAAFETRTLQHPNLGEFLRAEPRGRRVTNEAVGSPVAHAGCLLLPSGPRRGPGRVAVARAGIVTAGERPNPFVNIAPGYNATTPASSSRPGS